MQKMDSLTQIILGAAVGEVVLGKKIGNRAMLWGAVGGTIPDLDVMGKFFLSNIDNLAFHRGISHSIFFAIIGAFVFGWIVQQIYKSKYHKWIAVISKVIAALFVVVAVQFVFRIFLPDDFVIEGLISIPKSIIISILAAVCLGWILYRSSKRKYFSGKWEAPNATLRNWQWLFFWSVFTHPILDCFTMYGTQLFAPFSDYRVAWNTVSVVDFGYTLPFLICLIVASTYYRTRKERRTWNFVGIGISSAYLLFTVINKQYVNSVFEKALSKQGIVYERNLTGPTILNNILWNTTVETKDHFYIGQYSWFDEVPVRFNKLEKGHDVLKGLNTDPTVKTLRWFSKDYFNVIKLDTGYQFNDLRFGTFRGEANSKDDYIFKFVLKDNGGETYEMQESAGPPKGGAGSLFGELIGRIKGLKK